MIALMYDVKYCYENRQVSAWGKQYNEQDNGEPRFIHEYSVKHEEQEARKTALAHIINTNRQKITNNYSNSIFSTVRRLTVSKSDSKDVCTPKTIPVNQHVPALSVTEVFIVFTTGWDFTWNHLV
ncbi:hypothetical protein AVEN_185443-1 [Araneus ventricosus]|uniref:Uncharacterized protein n=1 Tax=Araneus ventricosus TaxID=182803 RepID=A0A4Y2NF10_ARAVE|nr:hypothetical protein AVEN_185443-1 [Araneus ventricosus]